MNARDKSIFYACIQHLQNIPFHVMDIFDDVDDKLFAFESLYLDIINEFAPVKNFHVRGNQVPFVTEEWRKSIRQRNKLWKKFTLHTPRGGGLPYGTDGDARRKF